MTKGFLYKNEAGIWGVKWSDLHSFSHGTEWILTELDSQESRILLIEDNDISYRELTEGEEVEFRFLGYELRTSELVFPEVEKFQKELLIKEYVNNGGKLFTISNIDRIRDGGTQVIIPTGNKSEKYYIHKDDWTLHSGYPTTNKNIVVDKPTQTYILDRIKRYKFDCDLKSKLVNTLIENIII